jgi:Uncharacterized conserved protein (DUF2358)
MHIIDILKSDYQKFPNEQTYSIYAENVYFQDPFNKFTGIERYQKMIQFIKTWFLNCRMDVHSINQSDDTIKTEWTLSWNTPLPWKPRVSISGWSELRLNESNLIISHIDYWQTSPLNLAKQHLFFQKPSIM